MNVDNEFYLVTVESSLHISKETITRSFRPSDTVGTVMDFYLKAIHAPGIGRVDYVLKDPSGVILKPNHSLKRALPLQKNNLLYLSAVTDGDKKGPFSYHNWWIIVLICLIFGLTTIGASSYYFFTNKTSVTLYGAVFDAGSVHTTVNLYAWDSQLNGTGLVRESFFCENSADVGISSFADSPKEVREYLSQSRCLEKAQVKVPGSVLRASPVFLGATAGMRILNATRPESADQIITNVSQALNSTSSFRHTKGDAQILSGINEGIYGWITVNFLSKIFFSSSKTTIGALDWGGASSQITFETEKGSQQVSLFGRNYSLYVRSDLCYGQAEALRRYFVELIYAQYRLHNGSLNSFVIASPCHPTKSVQKASDLFYSPCTRYRDASFQNLVDSLSPNTTFIFESNKSDMGGCRNQITKFFDVEFCRDTFEFNEHCLDSSLIPKPKGSFLAFSTYYYLLSELDIPVNVTRTRFLELAEKSCVSAENSCFIAAFMYELLTSGYHFENWRKIDFVKRIGDAEVGWTLGYMVLKTAQFRESLKPGIRLSLPLFIILFSVGIVFMILSGVFAHHSRHISRTTTRYQRFGPKSIPLSPSP